MNSSRFLFIIFATLASLLIGCSGSTEPEPDIDRIAVNAILPETMQKDGLEPLYISFRHADGMSGTVSFEVAGNEQFSRALDDVVAWDTTFTPRLLGAAADIDRDDTASLSYSLRSNSEVPQQANRTETMKLAQSPFFEGVIPVVDIHTGDVMDGYLTDQDTKTVFEIMGGEVYIPREQEITKSQLREGLEVLMQAPGYVPLRDVIELRSGKMDTLLAVPQRTENFDFSEYVGNLHEIQEPDQDGVFQPTGNFGIWSYPQFSTIDLYIADRSVYDFGPEGLQRFDTDNQKLWPSQGFVDDVLELSDLTAPLLEKYFGIDFDTYVQSRDADVEFPIGYPENSMIVGSFKDGPYDISQNTSVDEGAIHWTHMFQQVYESTGPDFQEWFEGTCFDFLQSVLGTVENPRSLCLDTGLSDRAEPVFRMNGTFGSDSGWYSNLSLTGKDGERVTQAWYDTN
jgi:hypothetical protein